MEFGLGNEGGDLEDCLGKGCLLENIGVFDRVHLMVTMGINQDAINTN
jgi:hypothetical protein